jgi:hypothetical protein
LARVLLLEMSRRNRDVEDSGDDGKNPHQHYETPADDEIQVPAGPNASAVRDLLDPTRAGWANRRSPVLQDQQADDYKRETKKSLR